MKLSACPATVNGDEVHLTVTSAGVPFTIVIDTEFYNLLRDMGRVCIGIIHRRGAPVPTIRTGKRVFPLGRCVGAYYHAENEEDFSSMHVHHRHSPLLNRERDVVPLTVSAHRSWHMYENNPRHRQRVPA